LILTDTPPALPIQVVFLTGQSDPARCALSPAQHAFLEALPLPAGARVPQNFPYGDTAPWRPTSLLAASLSNARQYLASRRPEFATRYAPAVRRQLAQARRTLILAGSNGLELLSNLRLPPDALDGIEVFAYGPVARRRPRCACVLVQGTRDWLSRVWFPRVDHRVNCGHLDYLESPQVLELCAATVQRLADRETA
jgi:hypothetical protein